MSGPAKAETSPARHKIDYSNTARIRLTEPTRMEPEQLRDLRQLRRRPLSLPRASLRGEGSKPSGAAEDQDEIIGRKIEDFFSAMPCGAAAFRIPQSFSPHSETWAARISLSKASLEAVVYPPSTLNGP